MNKLLSKAINTKYNLYLKLFVMIIAAILNLTYVTALEKVQVLQCLLHDWGNFIDWLRAST